MALPNGIESTEELLAAQAHVWNHMSSLINSMSLKCAIQLCIPDIIHKHNKPITLSQLIHSLPINKANSTCLARLMRILIHSKFFINVKISNDEEEEEEAYWLTPASRLLLRDEPLSIAPLALAMLDPVLVDPWHHVSEWFQNDRASPFVTKHGRLELIDQRNKFNEGMDSDARFVSSVVIKECRQVFDGLKSMVDVGGGIGTVARAITEAFPA
ncbi:UNVERIFIED_CONTAM: 8-hydroxyquercetin 8-O-methyltransferase [Sesamum latifolium]|uniref:8-hydroxyquercetin 8-O-methyltransferase n=1 Tax=Sesamum latifolium TaxID=2727402 RepID=A0AAW2TK09_9LAMI